MKKCAGLCLRDVATNNPHVRRHAVICSNTDVNSMFDFNEQKVNFKIENCTINNVTMYKLLAVIHVSHVFSHEHESCY